MPPRLVRDFLTNLEENRRRRGLASDGIGKQLRQGAICTLEDEAIRFPKERLPDANWRSYHAGRRAIVIHQTELCQDDAVVTVHVVPCSASQTGAVGRADFLIPENEPGFTKDRVVAFVSLAQPVLKSEIKEVHGQLQPQTLGALMEVVAFAYRTRP